MKHRRYMRNFVREAKQVALEREASRLIREADRRAHRRPKPATTPSPLPPPSSVRWAPLSDLKCVMRARGSR
jgi:hypothetical protein